MRTGVEFEVSDEQRRRLEAIANDGNSKLKHARRARIILARHRIAPHRWRHFKISKDPQFEEKTRDITGLYMNPPDRAVVLSIDGKTQIQALARTRKGLPMKPGRPATMTRDYKRHGATNLFAALNILDGKAVGRHAERHRSREFLDQVDSTAPAGLAIHAILDNCAAHKHGAVGEWLADHPRWTLGLLKTPRSAVHGT